MKRKRARRRIGDTAAVIGRLPVSTQLQSSWEEPTESIAQPDDLTVSDVESFLADRQNWQKVSPSAPIGKDTAS
ncbi:hypothetical protein LTR95_005719 [Oleoguttula sp. CCFEE 5521]